MTAQAVAFSQQQNAGANFPVRLQIPKIKIDTNIEYVGLDSSGAVGVPSGPINVAWFNQSPLPGEVGNAIIDGHAGWHGGVHSVFDDLYQLKKGDKVYIKDKDGTTIIFVVTKTEKFANNANASELFTSSDNLSHLNLVTCAGTWDPTNKTHSQRLVVFTDKE